MRRNKRKKRAVRLGGLVLLIVVLAGFMMLFQVRTVNVYGNSRHAAEEISDGLLDGFLMKNTLYLLSGNTGMGRFRIHCRFWIPSRYR